MKQDKSQCYSASKYADACITTYINNLSFFWIVSLKLSEVQQIPLQFSHFQSNYTYVLIAWVGVNSRWGSIVSISVFDWGSIWIFVGWGSNQDWGSICADTVIRKNERVLKYNILVQFYYCRHRVGTLGLIKIGTVGFSVFGLST